MAAAAVFVRRGERTRRVSGCQKDTTKIQPAKVATILDEKHKRITNLINKGCLLFYIICPPLISFGDRFGLSAPWETLPPELCWPLHEVVVPHRKRDSPLRRLTLHSSFNLLVWFRLLVACFTHHFCPSDIHSSIPDVLFSFLDSPFDLGGVLFLPSSCFCLLIAPFCSFPCCHCSFEAC